jgi:hypothetical protein
MQTFNIPRTASRIALALNPLLPKGVTLSADVDGTIYLTDSEGANPIVFSDMVNINQVRNGHDQRTAVEISARNVLDQIRELLADDEHTMTWPTGSAGPVDAHASTDDKDLVLAYGSMLDASVRIEVRIALKDLV